MNLTLLALAVAMSSSPVSPATQISFCQHLAAELKMKPIRSDTSSDAWGMNAFGLGDYLLGGNSFIKLSFDDKDIASMEEYRRIAKMCDYQSQSASALCHIEGPAQFIVQIKDKRVQVGAPPGERADVSVIGSRIRCEGR